MNFFKKRYKNMMNDVEKFASTKNVPKQSYSIFQVFLWISVASSTLAIFTLYLINTVQLPDNIIVTVMLNMIIPIWGVILFFGVGKYFFYARILEVHYAQKLMAYLINKLDMIWWRKYKKHSPLTEGIFKMQERGNKVGKNLNKRQNRILTIVLMVLVISVYGYSKLPVFEEMISGVDQTIKHEKEKENNFGRIFDGMNGKLETHT